MTMRIMRNGELSREITPTYGPKLWNITKKKEYERDDASEQRTGASSIKPQIEKPTWSKDEVKTAIDRLDRDTEEGHRRAKQFIDLLYEDPEKLALFIEQFENDSDDDEMGTSIVEGLIKALGLEKAQEAILEIPTAVKHRLIEFLTTGDVYDDERSAAAILEQNIVEENAPLPEDIIYQNWSLEGAQAAIDGMPDEGWQQSKEWAKQWLIRLHEDPIGFVNSMDMLGYNDDYDRAAMYFVYGLHDGLGAAKAREVLSRLPADILKNLTDRLSQNSVRLREWSAAQFLMGHKMAVSIHNRTGEDEGFLFWDFSDEVTDAAIAWHSLKLGIQEGLSKIKAGAKDFFAKFKKIQAEADDLKKQREALQQRAEVLKARKENLEEQGNILAKEAADLQQRAAQLNIDQADLKLRANVLIQDRNDLMSQQAAYRDRPAEFWQQINLLQQREAVLNKDQVDLVDRGNKLSLEGNALRQRESVFNSDKTALEQDANQLQKEGGDLKLKQGQLESEFDRLLHKP